MLLKLGMLARM